MNLIIIMIREKPENNSRVLKLSVYDTDKTIKLMDFF